MKFTKRSNFTWLCNEFEVCCLTLVTIEDSLRTEILGTQIFMIVMIYARIITNLKYHDNLRLKNFKCQPLSNQRNFCA
jgi:hypothetical protein